MAIRLVREALATADLRRLQIAWAAVAVGGWVFMVALAVHAYAVGGAAAVGLAALVRTAPAGLAAPPPGPPPGRRGGAPPASPPRSSATPRTAGHAATSCSPPPLPAPPCWPRPPSRR